MTLHTLATNRGSITVEDINIEDLFVSFDISARDDYPLSHGGTWLMDIIDNNTILFEVHIPALPPGQTATIARSVVFPAGGGELLSNVVTANPSVLDPNTANNSYTFLYDKN